MARRTFFSFHYKPDNWRAAQVRNIGMVDGNRPVTDNEWETITKGRAPAIKKWIARQLKGRSCTVVLVGSKTAGRKWISYEISESWNQGKGVVGIRIHGLEDSQGKMSSMGGNPFDHVTFEGSGKRLSTVVKCYNPKGTTSKMRYDWIKEHLANAVEEAVTIRNND